eukprot:TRINITY_DN12026_c0_g1_i2.p3 TRINITY_DN12026_c0_g1~~TRINITY_DN12026_c0_g1_i2.p3  ORF type:complete len:156 (-),score=10.88 TRINITY_DN12026_c0_g1_i2:26-493(-)
MKASGTMVDDVHCTLKRWAPHTCDPPVKVSGMVTPTHKCFPLSYIEVGEAMSPHFDSPTMPLKRFREQLAYHLKLEAMEIALLADTKLVRSRLMTRALRYGTVETDLAQSGQRHDRGGQGRHDRHLPQQPQYIPTNEYFFRFVTTNTKNEEQTYM